MAADVAAPFEPPTWSAPAYNITLNLTSLFGLPSRLLARIRKIDDGWPARAPTQTFPGPWGFFTSGYMLGLVGLAILMHRMQNIVIPSRHSRRSRGAFRSLHWVAVAVFPLDLTRTSTRLAFHLPSLYLLFKMLLLWFLIILHTAGLFPDILHSGALATWSEEVEMNRVCWSTFCAICFAFGVEGFVRALDGLGTGFAIAGHMNPNTSPFNLVGYAFLLYIYSSPITHTITRPDLPSRPDKHVVITIAIPLLQLTIFHILSVHKRWSTHRLLPTALSSCLSLTHFHLTLFSHVYFPSSPYVSPPHATATPSLAPASFISTTWSAYQTPATPTPDLLNGVATTATKHHMGSASSGPPSYPLLNYIPNIFETMLVLTILLTVVLNAIMQILVRGRVEHLFSGLGVAHTANDDADAGTRIPYNEDFGIILLRLGTASLEATGLRGWGNEVASVPLPPRPSRRRDGSGSTVQYGSLRMGKTGVHGLVNASAPTSLGLPGPSTSRRRVASTATARSPTLRRRGEENRNRRRNMMGLANEIRTVDLGVSAESYSGAASAGGMVDWRWITEVRRFGRGVKGVVGGAGWLLWVGVGSMWKGRKGVGVGEAEVADEERDREAEISEEDEEMEEQGSNVYARFLRGEDVSDDEEGEDYGSSYDSGTGSGVDDEGEEADEGEEDSGDSGGGSPTAEAVRLFSDLLSVFRAAEESPGIEPDRGGEVMLAHMAVGSGEGPLTRGRYGALMKKFGYDFARSSSEDTQEFGDSGVWEGGERDEKRETVVSGGVTSAERLSVCVICTVEGREIICWPCRCLSMCDGCREALAAKGTPGKHRCPCCRQSVEGYSRIYVP